MLCFANMKHVFLHYIHVRSGLPSNMAISILVNKSISIP